MPSTYRNGVWTRKLLLYSHRVETAGIPRLAMIVDLLIYVDDDEEVRVSSLYFSMDVPL